MAKEMTQEQKDKMAAGREKKKAEAKAAKEAHEQKIKSAILAEAEKDGKTLTEEQVNQKLAETLEEEAFEKDYIAAKEKYESFVVKKHDRVKGGSTSTPSVKAAIEILKKVQTA